MRLDHIPALSSSITVISFFFSFLFFSFIIKYQTPYSSEGYPPSILRVIGLSFLLLLNLEQQRTVDTRQHTTKGDGGANQGVQFFVTTDGKLQVSRCDTLDLEVLGRVTCKFQNFGSQVFKDSSDIDSS